MPLSEKEGFLTRIRFSGNPKETGNPILCGSKCVWKAGGMRTESCGIFLVRWKKCGNSVGNKVFNFVFSSEEWKRPKKISFRKRGKIQSYLFNWIPLGLGFN